MSENEINILEIPVEELQTREGYDVAAVYPTANRFEPVMAIIKYSDKQYGVTSHKLSGEYSAVGYTHTEDIIRKPKKLTGWLNIYPDGLTVAYPTKELADRQAADDRFACINLSELKEGQGI